MTVMVIVALSVVAVMATYRLANLAEASTGNVSDYSRTFAAAEAILRDAEHDIRGRLPDLNNSSGIWAPNATDKGLGLPCKGSAPPAGKFFVGCRTLDITTGLQPGPWIPRDIQDYTNSMLAATAGSSTKRCLQGICVPVAMTDLADLHQPSVLAQMFSTGASYGRFTGANATSSAGNPSLSENRGATAMPNEGEPWSRYWIEVFRFGTNINNGASAASDLVPDPNAPFVYRITAIAQGRKPGSRVVLREIFVPNPVSQNN
jgi:type IV pilus assembly protein PilX